MWRKLLLPLGKVLFIYCGWVQDSRACFRQVIDRKKHGINADISRDLPEIFYNSNISLSNRKKNKTAVDSDFSIRQNNALSKQQSVSE